MKNKEIKLRAWHKKEKQMIDWFTLSQSAWNTHLNGTKTSLLYSILVSDKDSFEAMLFTGLHDKNGKEIWSKDLVRQGSDLYRIEICVGGFECIEIRELKKGGFIEGRTYSFSVLSDRYCEVIGNVFENPEILSDKH